jgi:cell division septal protein FtsQ
MFFRTSKNRRYRRNHVLDVKLSASQRRETRLRRIVVLLTVSLSVFAGLVGAWRGGEWLLRHFIYENAAFAIYHLQIETDGVISREQLRHWAGIKINDNLWALDLARVKRDLEMMPIIQSASIERVLPHTLNIRVTEREPIAQYVLPQARAAGVTDRGNYLLDSEGYVMLPLQPHQRSTPVSTNEHYPVLVGVPVTELTPGQQIDSAQVRSALRWIDAFASSPMAGVIELHQIDVSQPNVLVVTTEQGSEIIFGLQDAEIQIRRWRAIVDYGQRTGKHLASADLSISNNIPTRWVEASLVPPANPKPLPQPRNRRTTKPA